jgi:hypothetical protein
MEMTHTGGLNLEIGSLVLEGMRPGARRACAEEFTREFARLAESRSWTDVHCGSDWRIPALSIAAGAGDPPGAVGRALARSLFDALRRAAEES